MEIQDLILSIKQDISNLNRQIGLLQQVLKNLFSISINRVNSMIFALFEAHAKYCWIQIEKFTNTFKFSGFCFTSIYLFCHRIESIFLYDSRN
jgi:hypothetical protein